jgi:hypothetical protein
MDIQVELNQQEADRQARALAALLVENPNTRKEIRKLIQKELAKARNKTSRSVKGAIENDPRQAYRAVLHSVWKKALGGSLKILSRRKAGPRYRLIRDRKLDKYPHQRGGNRRKRSANTERMDTYFGPDRSFVLRFMNGGTQNRQTRYGNRGSIRATGLFEHTAPWYLEEAANNLAQMINAELSYAFREAQNS